MLKALAGLAKREFLSASRQLAEVVNALLFFVLVSSLFPLAITPEAKVLNLIAPGVIWVAAVLATLLTLNRLLRADYLDGSLVQLVLSPYPLSLLLLTKIGVHWLLVGLPLVLMAPIMALLLHLPSTANTALLLSLLLGTPLLQLLGALGAALTLNVHNSLLLALLIFPLYVPVLIFGSDAVLSAASGLSYTGQLAWLAALLLAGLSLLPMAIAAALRCNIA